MRTVFTSIVTLVISILLSACGGGGGGASVSDQGARTQIAGAGIKGPLAFADTRIYKLDPAFPQFYDPNNPISTAITNDAAQISGLSVPRDVAPPYILTIGGEHAIDLNTSKSPVISTLVTVITENMLAENRPIYMTPLTTLAFHMAIYGTSASASAADFVQAMENAAAQASIVFAISDNISVDIFSSPLVIDDNTDTLSEQEAAVHHRAALEAFAAKVYTLSLSLDNVSSDEVIKRLAHDLQSDGVIDGSTNGVTIGGIDPYIMLQNPMDLIIPNTEYRVEDIALLMEAERILIGTDRGPLFHADSISLEYSSQTPTINSTSIPSVTVDSNPPVINNSNPGSYLLYADFENRSTGIYTETAIRDDFNVDQEGYYDNVQTGDYKDWDSVYIVNDPAGSGRGNVMRVVHRANTAGAGGKAGGIRWRADFTPQDDVYFAYDMYLPNDHEWTAIQKIPGLMTGTLLQASHGSERPTAEDLVAFSARLSLYGDEAWRKGDGALSVYYYDKDAVQRDNFLNVIDPTRQFNYMQDSTGQYLQPRGYWVRIEERVKMNTPGVKDGLVQVWITDPQRWNGAKLVGDFNHKWRTTGSVHADGIHMETFYGGDESDSRMRASKDNYHYFDNFIVSDKPITH